MKKIMFNDKLSLTQAVLEGRKTQTRRIIPKDFFSLTWDKRDNTLVYENGMGDFIDVRNSKYALCKVGEVVSVAQSYCSIADELEDLDNATCAAHYEKNIEKAQEYLMLMEHPGFYNKMFVDSSKMIHQIRITNVRVEKLQEISEDCCLKEGITDMGAGGDLRYSFTENVEQTTGDTIAFSNNFATAREAFAHLINKVSRKDVWGENPYVFVYDFKLIK